MFDHRRFQGCQAMDIKYNIELYFFLLYTIFIKNFYIIAYEKRTK